MKALFVFFIALATSLFIDDLARADGPPEHAVFALVVTSNKSQKLSRPDLHYADDDGARYYELFTNLAPKADVTLLTAFDRDSAKLFPELVPKATAPTVANVRAGFASMQKRIADATAKGIRADFYFVFAGHGDVEDGKGFLELEDGRIVSDDLTTLVASIPSTRSHVILDSCNSFFVINARKPGGHRFATGAEAGEKLNRSLPNVGVFLSTSAEAETFEWSELGAGIFSHAVRSGLSGAADANRDGEVSYEELAAFVSTASKDVKNPRFRPNVFARGPSGKNNEPVVNLANATAKLTVPRGAGRVTLRDADDLPWIDANFEAASTPTLAVPPRIAKGATLSFGGERHALELIETEGRLTFAASGTAELVAARGAGDIFKSLFSQPFGPDAVAHWKDEVSKEPPVYGVASDDVVRMNELLRQGSENARSDRYLQALAFGGAGTLYAAVALGPRITNGRPSSGEGALLAPATVAYAFAIWSLARTSREENAYDWFTQARQRNGSTADLMVTAEARLLSLARRDREERLFWRWAGIIYGGLGVSAMSGLAAVEFGRNNKSDGYLYGTVALLTGVAYAIPVIGTFSPTRSERLAELWERDPARARIEAAAPSSVTFKPTIGFGSLGLGGTF